MVNRSTGALAPMLVLCASAASLSAQGLYLPRGTTSDLAKTEGNQAFHLPGTWAPSRVVCIYRMRDLTLPPAGRQLQSLALRRDGLKTSTYKTHQWKLTVRLSAKGVDRPGVAVPESFAALHGSDETVAVKARLITWPTIPKPATPPAPFVPSIKFDQPFVLPRGTDLCVDMLSEEPAQQRAYAYWYADAEEFDQRKTRGSAIAYGKACPTSFRIAGISPPMDGETPLRIRGLTGISSKTGIVGLLWLGTRKDKLGTLSLPFELTGLGAPGCRLYVAPVFAMATVARASDALGELRYDIPLPGSRPALAGSRLYGQIFAVDPAFNRLGLRASPYLSLRLGQIGRPLGARLFYNGGPTLSDKPTGERDMGLVLRLD